MGAGAFAHYKKVTAREFLETLQKYPITQCTADHSMYMKALYEEDLKSFSFPTLKLCLGGGEPSNKQVLRKWKEVTGVELWDYYGQTEIVSCFRFVVQLLATTRSSLICIGGLLVSISV